MNARQRTKLLEKLINGIGNKPVKVTLYDLAWVVVLAEQLLKRGEDVLPEARSEVTKVLKRLYGAMEAK